MDVDVSPMSGEMSQEEQAKVQKILSLYSECAHAWSSERSAYRDYYYWWSGNHHWNANKADWQSKAAPNYIFSTIESTVPILTDGLPRWDVSARTASASRDADLGDGIMSYIWDRNRMTQQLSRTVRGVQMYGTDYWWTWWDPDALDGLGDIVVERVDPHNILVDPSALSFDDANYVIYAENVSLGYITRRWPERGKLVRAGVMDRFLSRKRDPVMAGGGDDGDNPQWFQSNAASYSGVTGTRSEALAPGSEVDDFESYSVGKQATIVHAYVRHGDKIKCHIVAGSVLLDEYDAQLDDVFPFSKTVNYPKDGAWHGASEIEFIISPQQIINTMLCQILDNAKLTGNPVLVYSAQSGFNPESYVAAPGVAISVNGDPNSMIKWMQVPELDPKLFNVIDAMRTALDTVSGVHDVTQGRRPAGITAASAIAELQEAAQVRIREKFRMIAAGLEDIGSIVWKLAQKYYDMPRILKIEGKNGEQEFVTLNESSVHPQTGQPMRANSLADCDFDIRIDLGAGLPANKIQKANQALQLFQINAIDLQALYDQIDFPNKEKVLERMMEAQKARQQQAMAAQSGAQPQGGGGPTAPQMTAAQEDMMHLIGKGLAPAP